MAAVWIAGVGLSSTAMASPGEATEAVQATTSATDGKSPEQIAEARQHWSKGLEAARLSDYERARTAFQRSYALVPHVETLRNLALAELEAGAFVEAASHLHQYLASKDDLSEEERRDLESDLAVAERMVGRLEIDVVPSDALLFIDGQRIEPPLSKRTWYGPAGKHRVSARLSGAAPIERLVELAPGQRESVTLTLLVQEPPRARTAGGPIAKSAPPMADRAREPWLKPKGWAVASGGVLTVLAVGAGVYAEFRLHAAESDIDEAQANVKAAFGGGGSCAAPTPAAAAQCKDLHDAASDKEASAKLANVGWIASGAFAAATLGVWLLWPSDALESNAVVGGPLVSSRGGGLMVTGRF